jgi:7-keto-8-aminopelargonate synthetase-like enzyme
MVARDKARIRTMVNAGLKREDLDKALDAFVNGGKQVGII